MLNIAAAILGLVYILLLSWVLIIRTLPPENTTSLLWVWHMVGGLLLKLANSRLKLASSRLRLHFFSFPCFLGNSLSFDPARNSLFFSSVLPLSSRDFRGSVGIEHLCFFGDFPCLCPPPQKRKGRTGKGYLILGKNWRTRRCSFHPLAQPDEILCTSRMLKRCRGKVQAAHGKESTTTVPPRKITRPKLIFWIN